MKSYSAIGVATEAFRVAIGVDMFETFRIAKLLALPARTRDLVGAPQLHQNSSKFHSKINFLKTKSEIRDFQNSKF